MFFVLLPQESLFRDAGHSVHPPVLLIEMYCPLQIIKNCQLLTTILSLKQYLKSVYRQSTCW